MEKKDLNVKMGTTERQTRTWNMGPANRPDSVLFFLPGGMMDGGLFITDSVTLSRTRRICSLMKKHIALSRFCIDQCDCLLDSSPRVPCFLVHGFMHDEAAVDVQDPFTHVDVLLQEEPDVVGRFQEEDVGGVSDEHLTTNTTSFSVSTKHSKGDNDKSLVYL